MGLEGITITITIKPQTYLSSSSIMPLAVEIMLWGGGGGGMDWGLVLKSSPTQNDLPLKHESSFFR